jgi:catecholate siderophore receptor
MLASQKTSSRIAPRAHIFRMNPEYSMTNTEALRPIISGVAATACLSFGVTSFSDLAEAQTAQAPSGNRAAATEDALALPAIEVSGGGSGNTNEASTGIARLPSPVQEIPQVVNVVPREIIDQQRAATLQQTLRNVPGITMSTGEGNGGTSGDQFRIRGMPARGDIFVDGLRDFGAFTRDTFNVDSVQVLKGPSGEGFGVGTAGGLINQTTKLARLANYASIDQSFGSGFTARTVIDANYQINATSALRVNALLNLQQQADRQHARTDREGFAISYGAGLGTDTTWNLNYSFLAGQGRPDMGVPMIEVGGVFRPATEYGLPRSTSYIRSHDRDYWTNHRATSLFSTRVNDWLTISNDTRLSIYGRDFSATNPAGCSGVCTTSFLAGGNPLLTYGAGGGMSYKQDGWGIQNVTTAKMEFQTGFLRHRLLAGIDANFQADNRRIGTYVGRLNDQTIRNPQFAYPDAYLTYPGSGIRNATATNFGAFVSDRVWFTNQLSVQAGVRWDYFSSSFNNLSNTDGWQRQNANNFSPSVALIFEPTRDQTIYASFARSYRPVGIGIDTQVANGSTSESVKNGVNLDPERSDIVELGAKLNFFGGRLGLTGAIFNTERKNSQFIDPVTGDVTVGFSDAGSAVRIRGFELGATGKITEDWSVMANYAYLNGVTTWSPTATNIGLTAPNVPDHNVTLWTTYDLTRQIPGLNGKLLVGGGLQYASPYWADYANTARIPNTFAVDAMVSYEYKNYRVSLNAYNLTNNMNYLSAFNATRAVPAAGRTVMLTIGATY